MSRQRRPLRRVQGADHAAIVALVFRANRWPVELGRHPWTPALVRWIDLRSMARRLRCRPSTLRRCFLGRAVSARAVARVLAWCRHG